MINGHDYNDPNDPDRWDYQPLPADQACNHIGQPLSFLGGRRIACGTCGKEFDIKDYPAYGWAATVMIDPPFMMTAEGIALDYWYGRIKTDNMKKQIDALIEAILADLLTAEYLRRFANFTETTITNHRGFYLAGSSAVKLIKAATAHSHEDGSEINFALIHQAIDTAIKAYINTAAPAFARWADNMPSKPTNR